jgi:hypothetical protein
MPPPNKNWLHAISLLCISHPGHKYNCHMTHFSGYDFRWYRAANASSPRLLVALKSANKIRVADGQSQLAVPKKNIAIWRRKCESVLLYSLLVRVMTLNAMTWARAGALRNGNWGRAIATCGPTGRSANCFHIALHRDSGRRARTAALGICQSGVPRQSCGSRRWQSAAAQAM